MAQTEYRSAQLFLIHQAKHSGVQRIEIDHVYLPNVRRRYYADTT